MNAQIQGPSFVMRAKTTLRDGSKAVNLLFGLTLSASLLWLSSCSPEPDHCRLAEEHLKKRLGIQAHYHTLKCLGDPYKKIEELSSNHKKLLGKSQNLAGLELQSLFLLPQQVGARQFPLDKAEPKQVRFIIQQNPSFQKKYHPYLEKLPSPK